MIQVQESDMQTRVGDNTWRKIVTIEIWPIMVSTIAIFIFFAVKEPRFLKVQNFVNILRNSSYLVIISSAQMLVLVIGGFDLSVGSVIAVSSITTALTMIRVSSVFPGQIAFVIAVGIVAAVIVGALVGLINGVCVGVLKVPAFMVTLASMSIASGVALYITQGVPIYGMPDAFTRGFGRLDLLHIPIPVYISGIVVLALWFVLTWTKFGRSIYAIGSNIHAARVSGIPVGAITIITYTLAGALAAATGILLTARVGSGEGTMGETFVMDSIAAAVLGGVSLRGGIGRIYFVAVGAVFLSLVTNGLNILRVDSKLQTIIIGIILISAVALDRIRSKDKV